MSTFSRATLAPFGHAKGLKEDKCMMLDNSFQGHVAGSIDS